MFELRFAVGLHTDGANQITDPVAEMVGVGQAVTGTTGEIKDQMLAPNRSVLIHLMETLLVGG
jgi:hypothetical protein